MHSVVKQTYLSIRNFFAALGFAALLLFLAGAYIGYEKSKVSKVGGEPRPANLRAAPKKERERAEKETAVAAEATQCANVRR